ncbi:copper amine oxidase N-terminal domain-containing protein [uncultured Megasphaera sp.]|uniref:copper amine oxidase N-terminal domain-containing protein n=1 Tax=uncultured Megasphaera sp. TaxID=165188 RepID=UPI0025EF46CD|nr:copper amine oxidase N-terminal domain-containing protein [uncultured Megasphaera sp.]
MMKKGLLLMAAAAVLACSPAFAYDEGPIMGPYTSLPGLTAIQQCQLTVAGKVMDPADGAVLQKNDVVMIPLRKVAEQLGYTVTWDPDDQSVRVEMNIAYIIVKPGEDWYERIGTIKKVNLNHIFQYGAGPINVNGTMYVPAQLFEAFYNNVTITPQAVTITPADRT